VRIQHEIEIARQGQVMMFKQRVLQNQYTLAYYEIEPAVRIVVVANGLVPTTPTGTSAASSSGEGGGASTTPPAPDVGLHTAPVVDLHTEQEFRLCISLGNGRPDETLCFVLVVDPDDKLDHVLGQIQYKMGIPQKRMQGDAGYQQDLGGIRYHRDGCLADRVE
jgi:hypothetical protein